MLTSISNPVLVFAFAAGLLLGSKAGVNGYKLFYLPGIIADAELNGEVAEKAKWQKLLADAKAESDRKLAEQQRVINDADRAIVAYRIQDRLRTEALRTAIEGYKADAEKPDLDHTRCVLPDSVRKAL